MRRMLISNHKYVYFYILLLFSVDAEWRIKFHIIDKKVESLFRLRLLLQHRLWAHSQTVVSMMSSRRWRSSRSRSRQRTWRPPVRNVRSSFDASLVQAGLERPATVRKARRSSTVVSMWRRPTKAANRWRNERGQGRLHPGHRAGAAKGAHVFLRPCLCHCSRGTEFNLPYSQDHLRIFFSNKKNCN